MGKEKTTAFAFCLGLHEILFVFFSWLHFFVNFSERKYEYLMAGLFVGLTTHTCLIASVFIFANFQSHCFLLLGYILGIFGWVTSFIVIIGINPPVAFIAVPIFLSMPIFVSLYMFHWGGCESLLRYLEYLSPSVLSTLVFTFFVKKMKEAVYFTCISSLRYLRMGVNKIKKKIKAE